jgi:hypothetical protein
VLFQPASHLPCHTICRPAVAAERRHTCCDTVSRTISLSLTIFLLPPPYSCVNSL